MGRRVMDLNEADPKGLIRESYRIEGISAPECRSIFLDWALSLKGATDPREAMRAALAHYGGPPDHPMTHVLTDGLLAPVATPGRRRRAARLDQPR